MEEFSRNSVPSNELQIYTWYILQYIDVAIVLAKSKVGPLQLDLLFHWICCFTRAQPTLRFVLCKMIVITRMLNFITLNKNCSSLV